MKISKGQLLAYGGVALLMVGLGILVALAQQRQDLRERVDTQVAAKDNALNCDPGVDPYVSRSIVVTNNSDKAIDRLVSNVFRCKYAPNKIKKGYVFCDSNCNPAVNPDCLVGTWDQSASTIVSIAPGETKTFTMTVNPCEIAQIDVYNEEVHTGESDYECWNNRSQYINPPPPNFWPGGIAFGIDENPTGYNAATGTCPVPTNTPPPTSVPTNTPPPTTPPSQPTRTPTPQPTAPPGQPTYTPFPPTPTSYYPYPTAYPTTPVQPPPATPVPTRPVAGSAEITAIGILGGVGLLIIAAFAL
jgi:hypothetical protein